MPLSEHDQEVLAQLERELYSDDAKLVKTLRSTNASGYAFRRLSRCGFVFTLGLVTMVLAVMTGSAVLSILLGLLAFLVMLLAALRGSAILRRLLEGRPSSQRSHPGERPLNTFRIIAERAYQRWQHRLGH